MSQQLISSIKKKLKVLRSKRGLSPVVSAMFLMVIILAAIGISLGIIYPQLNELDDDIALVNAATAIKSMDKDIKLLISNQGGSISRTLEIGYEGVVMAENEISSNLLVAFTRTDDASGTSTQSSGSNYTFPHNRFIISHPIAEDTFEPNTHSYLTGSGEQGQYFLNESDKAIMPWTIMNQSRFDDFFVNSSLSYRGLIGSSKVIDNDNARIELTLSVQLVEFSFPGKTIRSGHNPNVILKYEELNVTTTGYDVVQNPVGYTTVFSLKINTLANGITTTEVPYKHEAPTDNNGFAQLWVRFKFITHHISIQF